MATKIALLIGPSVALLILLPLLESAHADPALVVVVLVSVAVVGGAAIGIFWPGPVPTEPPRWVRKVRERSSRP
jgi:hypothetical protein